MKLDVNSINILVLDDDKKICDLITVFFKVAGKHYNVVSSNDVPQAVFKLENQEFDLLIIDKNLPGKSGIDFIKQVRKMIKHNKKKILLLSAALEREDVLFAVEHNVHDILVKPFNYAQLMEKVSKILKKVS